MEIDDRAHNPLDLSLWPKGSPSYLAAAHVGSMLRSGMDKADILAHVREEHNSFRDSNRTWPLRTLIAADDFRICVEKTLTDLGHEIPEEERITNDSRLVPIGSTGPDVPLEYRPF